MYHWFLGVVIFLLILICRWENIKIWRWKKRIHLYEHLKRMHEISDQINGFTLSKQARKREDAIEYVYGETDLTSFAALLSLISFDKDSIFYDLGSGTGKLVLFAAMLFPLKKSCGVEYFQALYQAALVQKSKMAQYKPYQTIMPRISFIHKNYLQVDISDAHIIFINTSTCIGETWLSLNQKLACLPNCHTIITTTKPLTTEAYQLTRTTWLQMSWGEVKAFMHVRVVKS